MFWFSKEPLTREDVISLRQEAHRSREALVLRCRNLAGANLSRFHLIGVDLSGANLSRANLEGANLNEANLSYANLKGANLSGANLSYANLERANRIVTSPELNALMADFLDKGQAFEKRQADLSQALEKVNRLRANLSYANLEGANLNEADLSSAHLIGAGANLAKVDLRGARLGWAKVTQNQLQNARSLEGATMPDGTIHVNHGIKWPFRR